MNHTRTIILAFLSFVVVAFFFVSVWGFSRVGAIENSAGAEASATGGN